MRIRNLLTFIAFSLLALLPACQPDHPTPFDALTEWPGKLEGLDPAALASVQVLQEEEVAGGLVILYSIPAQEPGQYVLASTFVTPDGGGWLAQSSGWSPYSDADEFVTVYIAGGNITDLTTVSGISRKGDSVRIHWSDGQIDLAPIEDGSFLFSRPETLMIQRVELLDGGGNVLESSGFATAAAEETPLPTETPGEIQMATPTAALVTTTPLPANQSGIPEIDQAIETIYPPDMQPSAAAQVECPAGSGSSGSPPAVITPQGPLAESMKGYTLQSQCWDGAWYFTLTLSLNSLNPCLSQEPSPADSIPRYTVKGIDSLKALLDRLPAGEDMIWCSAGQPSDDIVEEVIGHSEQKGLNLTLMADLQ